MDTLARFDTVSYLYPRAAEPALKDISLEVRAGEFLGLIGPTGAGKTTLCLAFNGIVPRFYGGRFFGSVTVAGLDTLEHPIGRLARHVGLVFEDPESQITGTSVENEVAFALENLALPREEIRERIPWALEAVRLEGTEQKHPQELSGGQKQRLAIAAALALQPHLLVLDEPTSQLDPVGKGEIFATLRELNAEKGVTLVVAGHAAEEMAEFCDRVALLSEGALLRVGPPGKIYAEVELLRAHHLRPPQVATTCHLVRKGGVDLPRVPVQLEEGLELLGPLPRACPPRRPEESAPPATPPLIVARDLTHVYPDGTRALEEVSLRVGRGEYLLIVGQNGAGKTTLVKHFLRLLEPTSGEVLVDGTGTRKLPMSALARRVGYVAQNPDHQIFTASVEDEVAFALRNLGYAKAEVAERTEASLRAMELLERREAHPLSLPKGDRARVVVASVLAMEPEAVIFDEPTTGQDYRGARCILDISRRLHEEGRTVIVVTHHLYLMPEYAERTVVMGRGRVLLDAPTRQAFHDLEALAATYLVPPQAVLLAKALFDEGTDLLTPQEVAACFLPAKGTTWP
jgi:energy-coupling factor transport system ATP-binding protein